MVGRLAATHL